LVDVFDSSDEAKYRYFYLALIIELYKDHLQRSQSHSRVRPSLDVYAP
jgi:hypothetical protein